MLDFVDTRRLMSETKFFDSYSRYIDEEGRYEEWDESVDRVFDMHIDQYKQSNNELSPYLEEAKAAYKDQLVLGAQRALQFGGDQLLKHQMRMYNCFSENTKFLTDVGIKSFKDFDAGDKTIVKTHTGNWKPATVNQFGKQQLFKIKLKRKNSTKTVYATRDHNWILKNGITTNRLEVGDKLQSINDTNFEDFNFDNATLEQKLMWCYGYVYGDGTVNDNGNGLKYSYVRLCGDDIRFRERFIELGFKSSDTLTVDSDCFIYTGKYLKTLPSIDETNENLTGFVRGLLDADGEKSSSYWTNTGKSFNNIYQVNENAQDFIRKIFPRVGAWIVSEKTYDNPKYNTILNGKEYSRIGTTFNIISTYGNKGSPYWTVDSIKSSHEAPVWCLTVEDDHSFILDGGILTGNCTSSYADRPAFFGEVFYILLCGAGAGFSVQKHHVAKISKIQARTKAAKAFTVPDSIEGWAQAIDVLLSSYFVDGGKHPEYAGRRVYFDLSEIRPKGAKISGGFKAPGPDGLRVCLDKVEHLLQGLVINSDVPVSLRPITVYDIVMHSADAVLSGGVRRSATICLFSHDDIEMMKAKTGDWYVKNKQRGRSNNSAVIVRDEVTAEQFAEIMTNVKQFGEPGFVFVDSTEHTTNPCVEIGMFPQINKQSGWQGCNLTEINGGKCINEYEFYKACRAAAILGTLQAGYTDFNFLSDTTKKIFDNEALLGVSITGWMNNPDVLFDENVLTKGAEIVKQVNKEVAEIIGINQAARTTCVKPSGNASVLLQTASGIHAEHAPMYLRNVTLNKETEVAQLIKETNPHMVEDSVWSTNNTDYIVSFPIVPHKTSYWKSDVRGIEHLELVKKAQKYWVEGGTNVELCADKGVRHNVSNTIDVDDWDEIEEYVFKNRHSFAGISFMAGQGDKAFNQAPNTAVITAQEMLDKYGTGAVFAAGMVVDALKEFDNLWTACATYHGLGDDISVENGANALKKDWLRRLEQFSNNYMDGDIEKTEHCLKDAYLLHKWEKINKNFKNIDWIDSLTAKKYTDVDMMGAAACVGGGCEIDF